MHVDGDADDDDGDGDHVIKRSRRALTTQVRVRTFPQGFHPSVLDLVSEFDHGRRTLLVHESCGGSAATYHAGLWRC